GRGIPSRNSPMQRPRQPLRRPMQSQSEVPHNIPYNDFQLMSSKRKGKNHVMDFKTAKKVDFSNFTRPVKLQRKDGNQTFTRSFLNKGSPSNGNASPNTTPEAGNSQQQQQQQQQHGPKTGADTSLIAPMGGATRNKQMLFKKRTKQIYLAKEDTRQLKEEEHKPWILEDYDQQNCFTGTYEGGQRSDYVFFVVSGNEFKVVPVDRWYRFQPKRNFKTFTLEEAEEQLKNLQKRDQSRWMMLKRNKALAEDDEEAKTAAKMKKPASDDEDESRRKSRQDSDIDDLDFDDVFQDDEEGGAEHELEDEDMKDSKERLRRETKGYTLGGENDDDDQEDDEDFNKLTSEGKQMKKLVRTLEKNRAYDSDEEGDPYASSADSEGDKEESKSEAENSQQQKKSSIPIKKKGPVPGKPMPKKNLAAKVKKEGLSRPIGRPGSPSLVKKEHSPPPTREASPVAVTSKKRKMEDGASSPDAKHRHRTVSSPAPAAGGASDDLITEKEVVDLLRGKRMTTKEFLMHFRKRIKKNASNRDIITSLLKKVARHNTTDDPNTRVLELRPELQ
ncbi:hypothetical protein BJV82DRAFT_490411, partial [Fennellomyces sp. T-0311]